MKPLSGIRVIELATFVAAPSCGRNLAYLGADVIKVEALAGDVYRKFTVYTHGEPVVFDALNGQKKSVVMNLKDPEALYWFKKLLQTSDVFLTNFRESALKKLGIDYDSVKALKPDLIYAHFSGYGPKGPLSSYPGFDSTAFAVRSGLYRDFVPPESEPNTHITGFGDMISGLALSLNILAALSLRARTGKGERIECSLNETAAWALMMPMAYEQCTSRYCRKEGDPVDIANASVKCGDGEWLYYGCGTIKQWNELCSAIGCGQLVDDPRCKTLNDVILNTPDIKDLIFKHFLARSAEEWIRILREHDVPCERHRHIREMASDEQLIANGFIQPMEYSGGRIMLPNPPLLMESLPSYNGGHGPLLGEHTDELMKELGCTEEALERMKQFGTVIG